MQPNRFRTLFSFIVTFLFSLAGYSQNSAPQFSFNHLTVKDGLSHGIVNAFCQDKDGFLWIGTFDGLNRFDGSQFKVFKSNRRNPNSLPHNVVHDVCVDQHDDIWSLTEGGVSRYNKKSNHFENYFLNDDSTGKRIVISDGTIICDRQGLVWVGTPVGLCLYIPEKKCV